MKSSVWLGQESCESLRQPIEDKTVAISRTHDSVPALPASCWLQL